MTSLTGEAPSGFPANTNHEQQNIPKTFDEAFSAGRNEFYMMMGDPGFTDTLEQRKISLDDTHRPAYWAALSDYARNTAKEQRKAGADERSLAVTELCASTADFVFNKYALDQTREKTDPRSRQIAKRAKRIVTDYNGMIRNAAEQFPDVHVSQMSDKLISIANAAVEHPVLRHNTQQYINSAVRGAQHEVAVKDILDKGGFKNSDTSVSDDVRGVDRRVTLPNGQVVKMDVKASAGAVSKLYGSQKLHGLVYHWSRDNQLTVHPNIGDEQLRDRFFVDSSVAVDRAHKLGEIFATDPRLHAGRHAVRYAVS